MTPVFSNNAKISICWLVIPVLSRAFSSSDAVGMSTLMAATLKIFYYRIQNQVFMMSFSQQVWVIMFVFALSFIALWRIRFKAKTTVVMDSH